MLMNNAASAVQLVFRGQPPSGAKAHSTWCGRSCTPERRAPPVAHIAGVKQVRNFGELGNMKRYRAILLVLVVLFAIAGMSAQDWIRTGTGLGVEKVRLAVPDFKQVTTDTGTQNLSAVFNVTLWNDLQSAGIFDMVSKSFYPMSAPGAPQEVHLGDWSSLPPNASMLAFGNLGIQAGSLNVQGWLYDTKNPQSPQVLC